MILVSSYGPASLDAWRHCFAQIMGDIAVAAIDDPSVDVNKVDYVFVYKPPRGRLAQFPNLKLILSMGAGVDHIVSDPTWPRHVPLVRMGGEHTTQRMAEYICLAALCLLRDMPRAFDAQRRRTWDHFETARSARQTRVGIMGIGNLGLPSARMLQALGFLVSGWSRTAKSIEGFACHAGQSELNVFLAQADILVCLLPETPETRGIINKETIKVLPRGAGIVNAARGAHVVISDLIDALDDGHLAGAVLDVFDDEPLSDFDPIWGHPKIIVTPHIASLADKHERVSYIAEVIKLSKTGDNLPNLYNIDLGY